MGDEGRMLGSDPGAWRRTIKALVAEMDPDVGVLIGRENATGHHPVRLTLEGCRETLFLYDDQVVAMTGDEGTRATIRQELKDALALLRLKAQITRAALQAHPARRVVVVGPVACAGGETGAELRGDSGFPSKKALGRTYAEALENLQRQVLAEHPPSHH